MIAFALLSFIAALPTPQDQEPPAAALTGPSSARLALPVGVRFDDSVASDATPLVAKSSGRAELSSRDPVTAVSRFAPAVARRHFEEAAWGDKASPRSVVVKSVAVTWSDGPHYEVKVVVDRYEGERRVGQATGSGYGAPDRKGQRIGAAYAGPFGAIVHNDANQPKPADGGAVLQYATVAALDSALMQLSAIWAGEQLAARYRLEAEEAMRKASAKPKRK